MHKAKIEELGESEEEKDSEKLADWAMLMHVFLLICVFVIGFALSKLEFKYMGEAGVGLVIGVHRLRRCTYCPRCSHFFGPPV